MKCLITGGSSGIGKDMAKTLSLLGNEVILVSKDENKLISACEEIKNSHYYVCDLSYDVEVNKLCEYLLKEKPDIVINDAGFGAFGDYSEVSLEREMEMVKVNVISLHKITKTCLKYMEGNKNAHILNVASIAGLLPGGPLLGTYYATKSYVTSFTLAISEELRRNKSNVKIGVLCPGPVKTNFNNVAGVKFNMSSLSSRYVARYAIDKFLREGKTIIIPGFKVRFGLFFSRFLSIKSLVRITYKFQRRKK